MNSTVRKIAEQCSQPKARVNELDLVHLRPYIEGFLDPDWLRAKFDEYESWTNDNSDPFLQRNLHRPIGLNTWRPQSGPPDLVGAHLPRRPLLSPPNGAKASTKHSI